MRFIISRASQTDTYCRYDSLPVTPAVPEAVPIELPFDFGVPGKPQPGIERACVIEVNSFEELLALLKRESSLILKWNEPDWRCPNALPEIQIYDDYVE